jgi:hypothetical protein
VQAGAVPQIMWVDEDRLAGWAAGALVLASASDNAFLVTLAGVLPRPPTPPAHPGLPASGGDPPRFEEEPNLKKHPHPRRRNRRRRGRALEESTPAEGRRPAAERTHLAHTHIAETQFANPSSGAPFMTPRSRMRELCAIP